MLSLGIGAAAKKAAPAPVSGLKATAVKTDRVTLKWNRTKGVNGFLIYSSENGAKYKAIRSTFSGSYTVISLKPATNYRFIVKSFIKNGKDIIYSKNNKEVKIKTLPAKVSGFKVMGSGDDSISLSWNAQNGVSGYIVYQKADKSNKYSIIAKTAKNSYTVKKVIENKKYTFAVKAYYLSGKKTVASATYPTASSYTSPKRVGNLKIITSCNRFSLSWEHSKKADGYVVYIKNNGKWEELIKTKNNYLTRKMLTASNAYEFGVSTYKDYQNLRLISSDISTLKTRALPNAVKFEVVNENNIFTLNWQKEYSANQYIVYSMLPGENWVKRGITTDTSFSFIEDNCEELFVTVRAVIIDGGSKYSGDYVKKLVTKREQVKKIVSFGDSIANGAGSFGYSYSEIFARNHNLELTKVAVNGACLSFDLEHRIIAQNVLTTIDENSDFDYVLLEGGCNDYYYNLPLGEVSEGFDSEPDTSTVCGALEKSISHIKECLPEAKIIFVLVHNASGIKDIPNSQFFTFEDYALKMKAVCEKYGIPVADCLNSALNTADLELSRAYTTNEFGVLPDGDGLHPNEAGYQKFYMPIIEQTAIENNWF